MSKHSDKMLWRRGKVMELSSQGNNQTTISQIMQVSLGTVNSDLQWLRRQSRINIQKYNDQLPHEYDKCMLALTQILKEAFDLSHEPEIERRERLQSLSLIKEIISTKLDLLTNVTVVDDVVKFINKEKEIMRNINNNSMKDSNDNNNSNNNSDSDYNIVDEQKEDQGNDNNDDKKEIVTTTIDSDVDLQVF